MIVAVILLQTALDALPLGADIKILTQFQRTKCKLVKGCNKTVLQ